MSDHLERFAHDRYYRRRKVLKLFGGAFHLRDADDNLILYSSQKRFRIRENISLYDSEAMETELINITTQSIFDIAGSYAVKDVTTGAVVGQINGLSVLQIGGFAFGKPTRLTASVRLGTGRVVDIEREVELGGPLHSKGVLILSAFLGARFSNDIPLAFGASLVFEQSYGGVDGDSASSTELYALLSALSDVLIRQSLAVTGSVNQHGEVQAIGGVNHKIEGFFDLCEARGLKGDQGVLIPQSNVQHLMLRDDVVEACAEGKFHIYSVETIDQGIELLTGVPAGRRGKDGVFPDGSINRLVEDRLVEFAEARRKYAKGGDDGLRVADGGEGNGDG